MKLNQKVPEAHAPSHLPEGVGIGFKAEHFAALTAQRRDLAFIEIHAENYMAAGGPVHRRLERLRADYALSVHGVGLSIGGSRPARCRASHAPRHPVRALSAGELLRASCLVEP